MFSSSLIFTFISYIHNFTTIIFQNLKKWWSDITLQTRLMAMTTLVVSLLMSSLTFWTLINIQQETRLIDNRFGKDLSLLLAVNITPILEAKNYLQLQQFIEHFYLSTSSIRYILVFNAEGQIYYSIPFSSETAINLFSLSEYHCLSNENYYFSNTPIVKTPNHLQGEIIDIIIPLTKEKKLLGILNIGINSNPTITTSSQLIRDVSIAVFVSIWLMVILGAAFNAFTITKPIRELLTGVKNIASGDFHQRINLPFGGELGALIFNFNEMAERLEKYEQQNVEKLTSEKAKLETLVSTIADGAILLDKDLRIILVNRTAIENFGWEGKDIAGSIIIDYLPEDINQQLFPVLNDIVRKNFLEQSLCETQEICIKLQKNYKKTFRVLLTTVLDHKYSILKGIAITIQDRTEEVELNEVKNQFISNVSHELRTPLFNIRSFLETLYEYHESLDNIQKLEFLAIANKETERLTRLVNDVLDLSRLESDQEYPLQGIDLVAAIEQTIRTYQLSAKDKKIELYIDVEQNLPRVLGNYSLILQILANLIGNSLKFTHPDGIIILRTYKIHGSTAEFSLPSLKVQKVRVEICDTGIGISKKNQERIFARFLRIENYVHTLEGTGLGLSIVKNIIQKHNSEIHLYSELKNGSCFFFDLIIDQER
uniref:drug sensory protein A n=1 Tax=Pyropia seriata TaxID=79731 RepID=UPI00286C02B2|nr:drug sensory protein A [Neoporphyra seriata]WKD84153.1 drug sensory protein A [Neoporphyra seriata]